MNKSNEPSTIINKKKEEESSDGTSDEERDKEHRWLEKESLKNAESISYIHPMNKFSKMLEDMIIDDDPYFLVKYRSIHNHELDTNLVENHYLINESDIHRKGA